jgi:hypothetical protein
MKENISTKCKDILEEMTMEKSYFVWRYNIKRNIKANILININ